MERAERLKELLIIGYLVYSKAMTPDGGSIIGASIKPLYSAAPGFE
jgi:hypothetical protein